MTSTASGTSSLPNGPGAILVVLRRGRASTDVLLFGDEEAIDRGTEQAVIEPAAVWLPRAGTQAARTQWQLAEGLLDENRLEEVTRLYASTLTMDEGGEAYGVFVGFVDGGARDASMRAAGEWMDLREAIARLPEPWSGLLGAVRQRCIARSPDEALRVR